MAVGVATLAMPCATVAQDGGRRELHEGSAIIRAGADEFLIRILCDDRLRPELGFTTEANRITRAETGTTNMVTMRLRQWKDTGDVLITIDGSGLAWVPTPSGAGGVLSMDVVLRPGTVMRNREPVLVTYDMWKAGELPEGEKPFHFEANCAQRDPESPAYRKLR